MLSLYLAARYSRRKELCGYQTALAARGHRVTARWLTGAHQVPDGEVVPTALARRFAVEDVEDILVADVLVAFTEQPRLVRSRGGRHVELGVGIGMRRAASMTGGPVEAQPEVPTLVVVGPAENVFCTLDDIDAVFPGWDAFLAALDALDATCAHPGCGRHPWHRASPAHRQQATAGQRLLAGQ